MRSTTVASGSPQNTSTTRARRAASSSSAVLAGRSKAKNPTPTGRSVRSWTQLNCSSTGMGKVDESIPSPAAWLTAAASSGVPVPPPITASWIGARHPTSLVNAVANSAATFATLPAGRHACSGHQRHSQRRALPPRSFLRHASRYPNRRPPPCMDRRQCASLPGHQVSDRFGAQMFPRRSSRSAAEACPAGNPRSPGLAASHKDQTWPCRTILATRPGDARRQMRANSAHRFCVPGSSGLTTRASRSGHG